MSNEADLLTIEHFETTAVDERAALREALTSSPKEIPPKYLYDARGSELFETLTDLPEYYPTRAERQILRRHSAEIMAEFQPIELLELGSGASVKTRMLLEAMHAEGGRRYTALDVSEDAIREAADTLLSDYQWLEVHGVVADFHADLSGLEHDGARVVAFLGGTIGNLYQEERKRLLQRVRGLVRPGDAVLLGFDLVKGRDVLEAAYDDSEGRTRRFIMNVFSVMNRDFGANFEPARFSYRSHWDPKRSWVEMQLRAKEAHQVDVAGLDLTLDFEAGEHLRAEVSTKFTPERIRENLAEAGFALRDVLLDADERYGLAVAVPAI
ncbi:MAG: L-histidine N(alpha)-methyltransferase [Planctomycetota bacterium]